MLLNYKNEITILYNGADVCPVFNSCFVENCSLRSLRS